MKLFNTTAALFIATLASFVALASEARAQCASTGHTVSYSGWQNTDSDPSTVGIQPPTLGAYTTSVAQAANTAGQLFLIDASTFSPSELNTVMVTYDSLFLGNLGGVVGTYTVTNAWTVNLMEGYLSATCDAANVTVNASLMTSVDKLGKIDAYLSKIDALTNLPAAATLTVAATEITGTVNGSGTIAISPATLSSSVNLANKINTTGSGITLDLPAPYTVNSGATFTLTAAQANGRTIVGAGTVAISSTSLSAGTYDFDGITASTTMTATAGTGVVLQITAAQSGTMTVNPDGANFASATITGTANADTVPFAGINAIRTVSGLASADILSGAGQADSINGGAGNDTITGGDGVDTAVYSGNIGTIVASSPLAVSSSDSAADGTDSVSGVEILDFANGDVRVINTAGSSYGSLASFISANPSNTDKLFGALEITSTTFANGPTSADSLTSLNTLLGRMLTNSVITVNVLGMNSNQLNALVNPGVASNLPAITYPPFKVTAGASIQGYYSDLTSAIAGANAGETISISPGTYNQTASVAISKNLTITRNGSTGTVTIADTSAGAGVQKFIAVSGSAVVNFSNITFVGGSGTSSRDVINFSNTSSGTITDCVITASTGGPLSYGVRGEGTGLVTLSGTTLSPSTASNWTGVIVLGGCSVTNCTFSGAAALGSGKSHIGVSVVGGNATISGGSITGCASVTSGGVYTISGGTVAITGADLSGNYHGVMGANASGAISASSCNFSGTTYVETSTNSDFRNNYWGTTDANAIAAIALDNIRFSKFSTTSAHTASMDGPVRLDGQDRSYSTIQAALDASATTSSSTVLIGAGNYNEAPIIKDSGVTVQVAVGAYGGTTGTTPLVFTLDGTLAVGLLTGSEVSNLIGNTANNTLTGNGAANTISGGDGADTINSDSGADIVNGGAGNDTINTGAASDTANGGDGNDTILGDTGTDTLNGDAGNDTMTGGSQNDTINGGASGVDVDTAVFTGNLGTISGSATLSVTSSVGSEGTDTVSNVEIIDYANADVVIVGRAGSSIADLNTALSTYTGSQKFWGDLEINSSTNFTNSAQFLAIYNRLVTSGSSFSVNMSNMSADQVAAVNASYATVGTSINNGPYTISRIVSSASTVVGRAPTIELAVGYASAGDTVGVPAGTHSLASGITLNGVSLVGAGNGSVTGSVLSGGTIIDISAVPMSTQTSSRGQAILVTGSNVRLEGFSITSPTRVEPTNPLLSVFDANTRGSSHAVKVNPNGDGTVNCTGLYVKNVRFFDVYLSPLDLNTAADATVEGLISQNVERGYGLNITGASSNVSVNGLTVSNAAWGDVLVAPYLAYVPSGVSFTGTLSITSVTVQPNNASGNATLDTTVAGASNQRYNSLAQITVPVEFNRMVATGSGTQLTRLITRQGSLSAVQAAVAAASAPFLPPGTNAYLFQTVTNILGDFEVLSGGVALAGRATFADAVAAASNGNTVNVWTNAGLPAGTINTQATPAITIGSVFKTIAITGAVNLTSDSFDSQAKIDWFAPLVDASANFVIELDPMSDDQLNWAVTHEARYDTVNDQLAALNRAGAPGIASALDFAGSDMAAYNALPNSGSFAYRSAVSTDVVGNRGAGFASPTVADTLFDQLVDFRGKAYTLLNSEILDATMSTSPTAAAYAQVRDALALLRDGSTVTRSLTGETVISTAMTTALSNYASRQSSGRSYLRSVMNTARTASATVTAVNAASVSGFDPARAADTIAAGITSSTSTADIANAYLYQSTVAAFVPSYLTGGNITTINAAGMTADSLNAVAAGYTQLAAGAITGAFTITAGSGSTGMTATDMGNLLSKTNATATVTVNATGMSGDYFAALVANIAVVDHITNLSIDNAVAPSDITALLSKATVVAGSFPHITMRSGANSMSLAQIAAVNGSVAKVGLVTGYTVRVLTGSTVVHYNLYVDDRTASSVSYPGAVSAANTLKGSNPDNAYVVRLEAGTFALENVLTLGSITLEGAGSSGTPATWATKITPPANLPAPVNGVNPTNLIAVTGNGATVRGVHLEGYMVSGVAVTRGIAVASGTSITGLTIDNVLASLHQYGFGVLDGGSATTVAISNSKFAAGGNGIQVEASGSLNGLAMSGTELSGNLYGFSSSADPSVATAGAPAATNSNTTGLTNVTVTNCQFNGNQYKGLYFEKLNNATFTGITVDGNAVTGMPTYNFGAGFELNLKYGAYSNITITNATVSGNGTLSGANGIGLAIKARDDVNGPADARYNVKPASLSTVAVNGGTVSGSARSLVVADNVAMSTVTFGLHTVGTTQSALAISGSGMGVQIFGTAPSGPLNLGAISVASAGASLYVQNGSTCAVTATGASFGGANGATASDAQLYAIESKLFHKVDVAGAGLVSVKAGNVYVNSAKTVAGGVAAASAGNTVNVEAGNYTDGVVTVNTENLTINGEAPGSGVHGYSFLMGTANNLTLAGTALIDATGNGAGNSLTGSGVANVLTGASGDDTLSGGAGADTVHGDAGVDTLHGDAGADTMNGGADADTMNGGADADTMNGDAGADTMNGDAGADTMNGGADADVMSGGADVDSINGDAGNDSMNGGAGNDIINGGAATSDVDSAVFTGNLGAISGSGSLTVTSDNESADGSDTVSNVEVLDFADADVVIVGRGGSSFASLDAALTASSADKKFWGNLVITQASFTDAAGLNTLLGRFVTGNSSITVNGTGMNSTQRAAVAQYNGSIASASNLTLTSADLAADITTLLNESTSNDVIVQMASMNPDQIAAVNAGLARVATVNGSTVTIKRTADSVTTVVQYDLYLDTRNGFAGFPGAVQRANAMKSGDSDNAYAVEMTAGTFNLDSKIACTGITLAGAGMDSSIIDMSAAPMNAATGVREQGILVTGSGTTLRDFTLQSPNRAANNSTGAAHGIKTNPNGDNTVDVNGLVVTNVKVRQVKRSALDLNGASNVTLNNFVAESVSDGYGLAISGVTNGVTINSISTTNTIWGDVGIFPYPTSSSTLSPANIVFSDAGPHAINAITVQPYTSTITTSVSGAANQYHNASANVVFPPEFNRIVRTTRVGDSLLFNMVTRQAYVPTLTAAFVAPAFSGTTVLNILGDFEVVSSGNVALAGRSSLDAAITAASNTNSINVWPGSAVSLGAVITKTITITGSVALTNNSFTTDAILDSLVEKVASSATFTVTLTSMNDGQINRVAFHKASFDTISDQLWAVNNAGTAAIISALDLGGVSLLGYNALPEVTGFLYQSASKTDMTGNARAFVDVAAAGTQWDKYVGFRSSAYALLSGGSVSPIVAGDFLAGGRFVAVKDARAALDGRTLSGETVVSADLVSTITNFNGYAASGKAYLLASMNGARTSVTAVNAAASGINLDKARAADTIAAGINSSTSTTDIANAYLYQLAVAPYVTANMSGNSITLINAGGMNAASLNAIAAGASGLAANSIKGAFTINTDVSASNLDAILEKADAANSMVTIDASGMGADYFAQLVANIDAIDSITNLSLTSAVVAADIGTLLGKATGAIVNATGMAHTGSAGDQLNAVAANLGSIAADGIRGTVNLSNSTNNLGSFLDKCSQLSGASGSLVTVNASGMSNAKLTTLSSKIANIDSITSLTIASAQSATEIANLLTKSVDALVIATDMAYSGTAGDQLNAVAAGTLGIASNGIRGSASVSSAMNSANLAAFLSKCSVLASPADSTITVDATGMTASFDVLASGIAAIDTINNLSLTSAQTAATITALLTKSVDAVANATSMNPARLTALGGGASGLATDGVTGDLYITVAVSNITALLGKTAAAANVEVSAAAANATFKGEIALSANIAKIDTISSLALASSEDATEIASLLTKALAASANATDMLADQLTALGAGASALSADGITGTVAVDVNVGNLAALFGKTALAATVNVNAAQAPLSSADYAAFKGLISSNISLVDAITALALASSEDTTEIGNLLGKASGASADASGMSQAQLTALGAGASAIAADGITGTLAIDVTVGNLGALLGKTAVGATANVNAAQGALTAVNYASFKASLVSNITKVDSITSLALASSENAAAITALLGKCANLGATADGTGMDAARFNAIGAAIGKINDDGISGTFTITNDVNYVGAVLGKTQVAAVVTVDATGMSYAKLNEVAANSTKVDFLINVTVTASADISLADLAILFAEADNGSVVVIATGMNADYLNLVAANIIKVADNGITGTMIVTSAIVDQNLAGLLAKASDGATVEIDASGMVVGELADVVTHIAKVDVIYNLTVSNAQSAAQITALLGKSVTTAATGKALALAVATGMDAAKLNALGVASAKLAASGVSGTVVFTSSVLNANMGNLFAGKIAAGATVDVDAASMVANQLSTVASNIAQVASTYNVSLTSVQTAAEIDALLSKAVSSATTGKALAVAVGTSMSSAAGNQLAKLADNYLKVALNGITGNLTVSRGLTAVQITNLVSRISTLSNFTGGSTVVFNAADMSNDQLASLAAAVSSLGVGIVDITSLTVTAAQTASQLDFLLSAATTGQATVVATGMTSAQLSELATNSSAVASITGVANIDASVDPAAIAVIMNTSVSSGAIVNVDPTGFNNAQQQAYNNALAAQALFHVTDQANGAAGHTYVKANQTFTIYVRAENLPTSGPRAVAAQGRINYDSSRLTFVSLAGGADMPTLLTGGDGVTGTQRHVTFYTGIDYTNAANVGIYEGVVATITFRATVDGFCSASDLCSLNSSFANRLAAGGTVPSPIAAIGTTSVEVSAQKNLALSGVPSGAADASDSVDNMSYYADASSTTGAFVADPGVTSANNCGAETVTISIAYPNSTTGTSWPTEFPIGTSRVTWSTIDEAGNTASAQRDIIVANKHLMTVNVDLAPTISAGASFTLPIRFRLSSGTAVTADVTFSATGDGAVRDVEIPVLAGYTCATAKDPINTIADSQAMSVSGTKWVFPGAFSLTAGDGTDDNIIDILDFGAFVTDRGANKTVLSRSNFNRDGVVNNADFGFISLNFLANGENCNGANFNGGARERISVKELRRMGLGYMEEADINGDGWVDVTDVALAGQGQYRRPIEGLDEADGIEQPNW